jgi:hypothetical protein
VVVHEQQLSKCPRKSGHIFRKKIVLGVNNLFLILNKVKIYE